MPAFSGYSMNVGRIQRGIRASFEIRYLQEMAKIMCKERDAECFIPENQFLVDNAAMIAKLGYQEFKRGKRSNLKLGAVATMPLG